MNESWDSDVLLDMEDSLNRIAPEKQGLYRHSSEGLDDMPAHVRHTCLALMTAPMFGIGILLFLLFVLICIFCCGCGSLCSFLTPLSRSNLHWSG